jgi:hypothetical protein
MARRYTGAGEQGSRGAGEQGSGGDTETGGQGEEGRGGQGKGMIEKGGADGRSVAVVDDALKRFQEGRTRR